MTLARKRFVTVTAAVTLALTACGGDEETTPTAAAPTTGSTTEAPAETTAPEETTEPGAGSVADMEADEIAAASLEALQAAEQVTVNATGTTDGQAFALDAQFAGEDGQGSFGMGELSVDFVISAGTMYISAGEDFWVQEADVPAEVAGELADRWLELPAGSADGALAFLSLQGFSESLFEDTGTVSKGETQEIDGREAIGLIDSDGGTLWVAAEGEPLPLRLEGEDGSGTFDYDSPVTVQAPADAESMVDLMTRLQEQLQQS